VTAPSPRIRPVAAPDDRTRELLDKGTKHEGVPLVLMQVLARRPKVLRAVISLGGALWGSEHLNPRDRELAILRTAWRTDCEYEFGHHRLLAPPLGVSVDEIERTAAPDLTGWSEADALLLRAVDELCDASTLSETTWSEMAPSWSEDRLLDLASLVGTYRFIATVAGAAALPREAGVPGWIDA
jgi:4-carboxymuconolactone decarboxylase